MDIDEAIKNNPHLADYLRKMEGELSTEPEFVESLSRDMGDAEKVNLIYPVGDPIFIHIYSLPSGEKRYNAIEPSLTESEKVKYDHLKDIVFVKSGYEDTGTSHEDLEELLKKLIRDSVRITDEKGVLDTLLYRNKVTMNEREFFDIDYVFRRNILGSGEIEPILRDPYVEDVHAIGIDNIALIHKVFKTLRTNVRFESQERLDFFLRNMSERIGRPVSASRPIVDAALLDGSRVNIIYSDDVSIKGPSFTIRKFSAEPISITQLVKWNTLSAEMAAYLWIALENGMSIFVCGETASGKTTTLNAMLPFIRYDAKIFTAEDTPEVLPPHKIWQRLLTRENGPEDSRVEMFDLLKAALRSRPNYIIVGEIRGVEGAVAFQAMQTGHPVVSTFHASSIKKMIQRFTGSPINVPITFMDNLNIVLIQQAVYNKGRFLRRSTSIGEIIEYSDELNGVLTKDVFKWDPVKDIHKFRGMNNSYILEEKIANTLGLSDKRDIYKELLFRSKIINKMIERGIFGYWDVTKIIQSYQINGKEGLPFAV